MYFWMSFLIVYFIGIPLLMFCIFITSVNFLEYDIWKWYLDSTNRLTRIGKCIYYLSTLGFVIWCVIDYVLTYLYYTAKKLIFKKERERR